MFEVITNVVTGEITTRPYTEAEIAAMRPTAEQVRAERNRLLIASDWTQILDAPVNREAWATYRKELRDISQQSGFPANVIWPSKPE